MGKTRPTVRERFPELMETAMARVAAFREAAEWLGAMEREADKEYKKLRRTAPDDVAGSVRKAGFRDAMHMASIEFTDRARGEE